MKVRTKEINGEKWGRPGKTRIFSGELISVFKSRKSWRYLFDRGTPAKVMRGKKFGLRLIEKCPSGNIIVKVRNTKGQEGTYMWIDYPPWALTLPQEEKAI